MKKLLLIFTILLISLAVSACSSKFNFNGSENESINEFNSEAKSDNSKSQEDLDLVKSDGEPQAVFTRENDPEVKTFECTDAPVRFSDLKVGDSFDNYKISKIYYNTNAKNDLNPYSGVIEFEGEKLLTGSFIARKELGGDFIDGLYFVPDNLMPNFEYNNDGGVEDALNGVVCGNQKFDVKTEISNYDKRYTNLDSLDFPVISKKDQEFKNFWVKALNGEKYSKKVVIRVNEIKSIFAIASSIDNSFN